MTTAGGTRLGTRVRRHRAGITSWSAAHPRTSQTKRLAGTAQATPLRIDHDSASGVLAAAIAMPAASSRPVILLGGSFQGVWRGIEVLVSGLSSAERDLVLGGTAERVYGL